jgi:hypothetical protein
MRSRGPIFALAAPLLGVLACGGQIDTGLIGGGSGSSGGGSGSSTSGTGSSSGSESGSGGSGISTSGGGSGSSGSPGSSGARPSCPAPYTVNSGRSCAVPNLVCPTTSPGNDCSGRPIAAPSCACSSGTWTCPPSAGSLPVCPVSCPPPAQVQPGAYCSLPSGTGCQGTTAYTGCGGTAITMATKCACASNGQWSCPPIPLPACPVDASLPACPDPTTLFDGTKCPSEGAQCPGNPLSCDGAIFYDAFLCKGGVFVTTATTTCGDGGYADAGYGG